MGPMVAAATMAVCRVGGSDAAHREGSGDAGAGAVQAEAFDAAVVEARPFASPVRGTLCPQ